MGNIKHEEDRQIKRINYRLTQEEFKKLQLSAETYGLTVSSYAKKLALKSTLRKPYFTSSETQKMLLELSRQGSNLNQIARQLNQQETNLDLQEVLATFKTVRKEYQELWQLLQK